MTTPALSITLVGRRRELVAELVRAGNSPIEIAAVLHVHRRVIDADVRNLVTRHVISRRHRRTVPSPQILECETLSPKERRTVELVLRFPAESFEKVGARLGVSESTMWSRLKSARLRWEGTYEPRCARVRATPKLHKDHFFEIEEPPIVARARAAREIAAGARCGCGLMLPHDPGSRVRNCTLPVGKEAI